MKTAQDHIDEAHKDALIVTDKKEFQKSFEIGYLGGVVRSLVFDIEARDREIERLRSRLYEMEQIADAKSEEQEKQHWAHQQDCDEQWIQEQER